MKKNKKKWIWIGVVLIVVAGGIFAIRGAQKGEERLPAAKEYAIVVSTFTPELKHVQLTLPYLALTQNDKDVNLASRIASRIEWIKASGSRVKKSEVIARLDNTTIKTGIKSVEAQIDAVETTLKNLEATHRRTLELLKVEGASIEQSQSEESKIAGLRSQVESLKQKHSDLNNMLTYAIIRSPVSGRISKTMVNVGDMAMPGHPVANVSATNGFYLLIRVPTDLKVYGVNLDGKFYEAIPLHSTFNSLAEYKVYVDKMGMTTGSREEVNVIVYEGNGLELPFDAILNRDGKSYVLVRNGDKAIPQAVNQVESGEQGIVVSNADIAGKKLVVAKQDILLRLLGGTSLKIKED